MTSRDGYNRNRPSGGNRQRSNAPQRQDAGWELDAEELERYMSGQSSKEPRFDPYGRSQSTGRTERMSAPRRQQPAPPPEPQYDDYSDYDTQYEDDYVEQVDPNQQWADDDYAYEDDYAYDQQPVAPPREQPMRQQPMRRQPVREPQYEPEYEDDLYEDPYVLDEEDEPAPRQPRRRPAQQRSGSARRPRPARQAPNIQIPTFISEAALVKDQTSLILLGVGFVSFLAMLIVVFNGRSGLPEVILTHVNANGEPANFRTSDAIWNLPLIAGMVTLISAVASWLLARWGEFLPRFLLGGAIAVQVVVWVAVIAYFF